MFVGPYDLPLGEDGRPARPYAYARPGFFADAALERRVSEAGADGRERIDVSEGDVLHVEDDAAGVYRVEVGARRGRSTLPLQITRIR